MNPPRTKALLYALPWLLLVAFPLLEVGAHAITRAAVAGDDDWRAAADFVRGQAQPRDLFVAAPSWADPRLRAALGDRIDLAMAGRSDSAAYERVWTFSPRGEVSGAALRQAVPDLPSGLAPQLSLAFGLLQVQRFDLGPSPLIHDLVEHVHGAQVTLRRGGQDKPCKLAEYPPARRGGLGFGVLPPRERFQCPDRRGFVWVAPVVMEDLDLTPRRCVFQHPAGKEPVRVTLPDVPLGERLVVHAGLYYEHERMREGAPVTLRVFVDDAELGSLVHEDGEGWKRQVFDTSALGKARAGVRFEVTSDKPHKRIFCWAASTRRGPERAR